MGKSKKPIGIVDGKFYPCPDTPNCVSTLATDKQHKIDPIKYSGSLNEAKEKVIKIIDAEFRSATFRFIDDVEYLFDDSEKIIHFRSRARLGHSDMGVNRKRMENIRNMYANL